MMKVRSEFIGLDVKIYDMTAVRLNAFCKANTAEKVERVFAKKLKWTRKECQKSLERAKNIIKLAISNGGSLFLYDYLDSKKILKLIFDFSTMEKLKTFSDLLETHEDIKHGIVTIVLQLSYGIHALTAGVGRNYEKIKYLLSKNKTNDEDKEKVDDFISLLELALASGCRNDFSYFHCDNLNVTFYFENLKDAEKFLEKLS